MRISDWSSDVCSSDLLRAVEEGLPLVRAANNGISAVVDSYGRIIDRINLNDRGIIDTHLPKAATKATPYSYAGNYLYLIELLLTCCVIFVARRFIWLLYVAGDRTSTRLNSSH